jgi:hypothetical protein
MYRSLPCVILPLLLMTSLVLALVRPQPENISSDNSGFYKIDDLLTGVKNLVIPSTYYRTVNHDDAKMQLTKSAVSLINKLFFLQYRLIFEIFEKNFKSRICGKFRPCKVSCCSPGFFMSLVNQEGEKLVFSD